MKGFFVVSAIVLHFCSVDSSINQKVDVTNMLNCVPEQAWQDKLTEVGGEALEYMIKSCRETAALICKEQCGVKSPQCKKSKEDCIAETYDEIPIFMRGEIISKLGANIGLNGSVCFFKGGKGFEEIGTGQVYEAAVQARHRYTYGLCLSTCPNPKFTCGEGGQPTKTCDGLFYPVG